MEAGYLDRILKTAGIKIIVTAAIISAMLITPARREAYAADDPRNLTVFQISAGSGDTRRYVFEPLEPGSPMPAGSASGVYIFLITGDGSADIVMPRYDRPGVYRYALYQSAGEDRSGYAADGRVYTVEAHADGAGGVEIIVKDEDGAKAGEVIFYNEYRPVPTDPYSMPDIQIYKTVFGSPAHSYVFAFALEASDRSGPMPPGGVDGMKIIHIEGSGRRGFGVWSYAAAGTYRYRVYEIDAGADGYTYDSAEYTITDVVRDDGGALTLRRVVTNESNKPVSSFIFNNYYRAGGAQVTPPSPSNPPNPGSGESVPQDESFRAVTNAREDSSQDPKTQTGTVNARGYNEKNSDLSDLDIPGNPVNPANPGAGDSPKTGDAANMDYYFGLLLSGGAVALSAAVYLSVGGKNERRLRQP